jgi:quercetin dioxygenase-like cupin family protein
MTQETSHMTTLDPLAVSGDEGEARWWFGTLAVIKTTAAETGGQLTIIDITNPAGFEAPLHVHHRDDEGFWILEGSATFEVGDTTIEARAGDYLFGPRDIPAPLHGRRRRLPDALHHGSWRHGGDDPRDQRTRGKPDAPAAGRRGTGHRRHQGDRQGARVRAARLSQDCGCACRDQHDGEPGQLSIAARSPTRWSTAPARPTSSCSTTSPPALDETAPLVTRRASFCSGRCRRRPRPPLLTQR